MHLRGTSLLHPVLPGTCRWPMEVVASHACPHLPCSSAAQQGPAHHMRHSSITPRAVPGQHSSVESREPRAPPCLARARPMGTWAHSSFWAQHALKSCCLRVMDWGIRHQHARSDGVHKQNSTQKLAPYQHARASSPHVGHQYNGHTTVCGAVQQRIRIYAVL